MRRLLFSRVGHYSGGEDAVEPGEVLIQISLSLVSDRALVRLLAVARVDLVDDLHALGHFAEGSKAIGIEPRVVSIIDEELRGPAVARGRLGKGHHAAGV